MIHRRKANDYKQLAPQNSYDDITVEVPAVVLQQALGLTTGRHYLLQEIEDICY